MVKEPGAGPGFFSGSARATEASSAHSASGTRRRARLPREADLTWMLMGAELPTRAASRVVIVPARANTPSRRAPARLLPTHILARPGCRYKLGKSVEVRDHVGMMQTANTEGGA